MQHDLPSLPRSSCYMCFIAITNPSNICKSNEVMNPLPLIIIGLLYLAFIVVAGAYADPKPPKPIAITMMATGTAKNH